MTEPFHLEIYTIRGLAVVLDSDLAAVYGVTTGNFNKSVQRNIQRFPPDFSFLLDEEEFRNLIFQIGTSKQHGGRRKRPRVFTEHGALMAATVLRSKQAISMSQFVIRAFVTMREQVLANMEVLKRLAELEKKSFEHDTALWDLYQKLLPLLQPPPKRPKRRAGFDSGS